MSRGVRVTSLTVPSHWSPARIAPSDWSAPDDHDRTTVQSLFLRVGHVIIADFDFSLAHNTCSPPAPPHHQQSTLHRAPSRTRPVLSHVYGIMGTPPCRVVCEHCLYEARKQSNCEEGGGGYYARFWYSHNRRTLMTSYSRATTNSLEVTTTNCSLIYLHSWKPLQLRPNQIAINIPTYDKFMMFDYHPCCTYCPPTALHLKYLWPTLDHLVLWCWRGGRGRGVNALLVRRGKRYNIFDSFKPINLNLSVVWKVMNLYPKLCTCGKLFWIPSFFVHRYR